MAGYFHNNDAVALPYTFNILAVEDKQVSAVAPNTFPFSPYSESVAYDRTVVLMGAPDAVDTVNASAATESGYALRCAVVTGGGGDRWRW